ESQKEKIYGIEEAISGQQKQQAGLREALIDFQIKELQNRHEMGQIDLLDMFNQERDLLQQKLDIENRDLATLLSQGAAQGEILSQKDKINSTTKSIYDLERQINGQTDIQFAKVKEMARIRDMMKLKGQNTVQIEADIIAEMMKSGATADQIAAQKKSFMASNFPMFDEGGSTGQGGMAILHADEHVLNRQAVAGMNKLFPGWLDWVNRDTPGATLAMAARTLAGSQQGLQNAKLTAMTSNVAMGGITINV